MQNRCRTEGRGRTEARRVSHLCSLFYPLLWLPRHVFYLLSDCRACVLPSALVARHVFYLLSGCKACVLLVLWLPQHMR